MPVPHEPPGPGRSVSWNVPMTTCASARRVVSSFAPQGSVTLNARTASRVLSVSASVAFWTLAGTAK